MPLPYSNLNVSLFNVILEQELQIMVLFPNISRFSVRTLLFMGYTPRSTVGLSIDALLQSVLVMGQERQVISVIQYPALVILVSAQTATCELTIFPEPPLDQGLQIIDLGEGTEHKNFDCVPNFRCASLEGDPKESICRSMVFDRVYLEVMLNHGFSVSILLLPKLFLP